MAKNKTEVYYEDMLTELESCKTSLSSFIDKFESIERFPPDYIKKFENEISSISILLRRFS